MPTDPTKLSAAKRALLAKRLRGAGKKAQPIIPRRDSAATVPLSFSQQRLWFLSQLEPDNPFYNIPTALRSTGDLDLDAFQQALDKIIYRHEILRTVFKIIDGQPQQIICDRLDLVIEQIDLSARTDLETEIQRLARCESQNPFDLECGPLLRIKLLKLSARESILLFTLHHIISDAWSTGIFVRELTYFYRTAVRSIPDNLPELPIQYADFAIWQRQQSDRLERQLKYWRQQFTTIPPVLALPTDRPRPAVQTYNGDRFIIELPESLTVSLKQLGKATDCTLFMVLLANFQALLHRYSNQTDFAIGTPIANRNQTQTEGLIGAFINATALRSDLSGSPTVVELLGRVRDRTLGAYAHQDLPFERIIDELEIPRDLSHSPLFQVMFVLQNTPTATLQVPGLTITPLILGSQTTKFDLTLICTEGERGLTSAMEFNTDLYDRATIERMLDHWQVLLSGMVAAPETKISDLPLLTPSEIARQQRWNQTQTAYPLEWPLHHWLAARASQCPEAIAVSDTDLSLTYREFDNRANQLGHHLQTLGVGPDVLVGVCLERSVELAIALVAILKAGGAYVPLDPDYPRERLEFMMADAQPAVLLSQTHLQNRIPSGDISCMYLQQDWSQFAQYPATAPTSNIAPENLAYVIYTSGSTGKPKGAMNTHRAICNRLLWMQETFALDASDVVLQKTPASFDVSVWEFFWPLLAGARLVMAKPSGHKDSRYLLDCIAAEKVTTLHSIPAMLGAFLEAPGLEKCTSLKQVIASGEALSVALCDRFYELLPTAELHNLYGPTEAAIDVSHWPCGPEGDRLTVPLGCPIANIQLHVLDPHLRPVPVGVSGELHIGGVGLARGYLQRPGLTAERFIPDPFSDRPGARLYKTGDLVRYLPTGVLEFLGRIDFQVKVRGLRIELGEIEANLLQHPSLREAIVTVQVALSGAQQLVAYGVLEAGAETLTLAEIKAWLQPKLPDYMVPGAFVLLEQFPLTPSGKVDRRALPAPHQEISETVERELPQTAIEFQLAEIWAEVLGRTSVGIEDNFFELGGDSILSLLMVSRSAKAGIQLTPKQLFQHQTIRTLARVAGTVTGIQAEQGSVSGEMPLLPIQEWFFAQALPQPHHWNQAILLQASQPLAFADLQQVIKQLLQHHDGLRSHFSQTELNWQQTIPAELEATLCQEIDLRTLSAEAQSTAIAEAVGQLQGSFDLATGLLLRVALFKMGTQAPDRLAIIIHHLLVDGVSWRILLEDVQTLLQGQALPPKTCSYQQWRDCLASYDAASQRDFWLQQASTQYATLPLDFPDGGNTYGDRITEELQFTSKETQALLQEVPQAYRAQMDDLLVAALVLAVTQWSERTDICIDFEGHGRADLGLDISRTVGWFTTLYPLRFDLAETDEFDRILKTIKEQLRQVPDSGLGYGILRYLKADADLQAQAAAPIRFNYLGQFDLGDDTPFAPAPEAIGSLHGPTNPHAHQLTVDAEVLSGQLTVRFGYSQAQYRPATISDLSQEFARHLRSLLAHCLAPHTRGYTPADFPLAEIQQQQLDDLVAARGAIADLYPLSPAQQGMLFHTLYAPNDGLYVTQFSYTLQGPLKIAALQQAWEDAIARHPSLRTAFAWEGLDQPLQYVEPQVDLPWTAIDCSDIPSDRRSAKLEEILYTDRVKGFAPDRPPLMRLQAVRFSDETHTLIWSFHHLILDGWSLPLVLQGVFQQYAALERERPFSAPTPPPYREYIAWLARQNRSQAMGFWRQELQDFAMPTPLGPAKLAAETPGSRADRHRGYACLEYPLTSELATGLQQLGDRHHLTLNTLVQGAWALLLSQIGGQEDVVFGATTAGRPPQLLDAERMVGVFINTLPVRVQVTPTAELLPWLQDLQDRQIAARQYEYVALAQIQKVSGVPQGKPLFESLVVFENYPVNPEALKALDTAVKLAEFHSTSNNSYPLTVRVKPGDPLKLDMLADLTRFPRGQIQDWLQQLVTTLQQMAANPQDTVGQLLNHLAVSQQRRQVQQRQTLETASRSKLKRIKRKAIAPQEDS